VITLDEIEIAVVIEVAKQNARTGTVFVGIAVEPAEIGNEIGAADVLKTTACEPICSRTLYGCALVPRRRKACG
jgi:hypothetical protein